ncbi:MAG: precorrin-6A/cobalt-precorrin-6A reductase [Pseudomonadota bacterium]
MGQIPVRLVYTLAEGPTLAARLAVRLGRPVEAVPWGHPRPRDGLTVSALHPFDTFGRDRLEESGGTVLHWTRPSWRATAQDRWLRVRDARGAARALAALGVRRAFVTAGRDKSGVLLTAPPCEIRLRVRSVLPHPRHPAVVAVPGTGPFSVAEERLLLQRIGIDAVVAHDAGGTGAFPKLAAARQLRLPVILLARPTEPRLLPFEVLVRRLAALM